MGSPARGWTGYKGRSCVGGANSDPTSVAAGDVTSKVMDDFWRSSENVKYSLALIYILAASLENPLCI